MPNVCPHCNQTIRTPKIKVVPNVDTATMTDSELFAHYKRTDRLETLRFWIRNARMSEDLRNAFQVFAFASQNMTIKPAAFDRQFETLKGMWRRESNAREFQAHLDAGDLLVSEHWVSREDIAVVPAVFGDVADCLQPDQELAS